MERINVGDKIQIIKADADEQQLLGKVGRVILISGDVYIVGFADGRGARVQIDQLKKIP